MAVPQTSNASDITTVIASLATRQSNRPNAKPLGGPKRAAILMLALGEKYGGKVLSLLDDNELRELSIHMSTHGTGAGAGLVGLMHESVYRFAASSVLIGKFHATE